jgi:hypothetical protein
MSRPGPQAAREPARPDGQPVSVTQTGERAWAVRPGRAVGGGFFWVTRTPGLAR